MPGEARVPGTPSPGLQSSWSSLVDFCVHSSLGAPSVSATPPPLGAFLPRLLPAVSDLELLSKAWACPLAVWPGVAAFPSLSLSRSSVRWVSNSASLAWMLESSMRPCKP